MKDDRIAAAVGNVSLLGVGYLLLRRWRLAIAAQLITVALVLLLVAEKALWCEVALVVWWVAVVAHGWALGGKPGTRRVAEQRVIALCVTVPVLFAGGFFRYEAAGIQHEVAEARAAGDCAGVTAAEQKARYGDRIADAAGIERLSVDVEACAELREIAVRLQTTWTGDTEALAEEFEKLSKVLTKPGQDKTVEKVLDEYLKTVTKGGPCPTAKLGTWLRNRAQTQNRAGQGEFDRRRPRARCAVRVRAVGDQSGAVARGVVPVSELIGQYPSDRRHVQGARRAGGGRAEGAVARPPQSDRGRPVLRQAGRVRRCAEVPPRGEPRAVPR